MTASLRALARGGQQQQALQQEAPLLAEPSLQGVLPREVLREEQEALRVREGPPQREESQVRGPELQLLGQALVQAQGRALGRKFLQQEPVLRGLLRRCRLLREPAQRQPRRCHLRRPEFLQ